MHDDALNLDDEAVRRIADAGALMRSVDRLPPLDPVLLRSRAEQRDPISSRIAKVVYRMARWQRRHASRAAPVAGAVVMAAVVIAVFSTVKVVFTR